MTREADDELADTRPQPRWDLKELLHYGIRRSHRWVLVSIAAAGVLGLYVGLKRPNLYTSEAKLLLRLGSREQLTPEVLVESEIEGERREARTTMQDEIHMLRDEAIYARVAQELGQTEVLSPADPRRDDGDETSLPALFFHFVQSLFMADFDHDCGPHGCTDCIRQAAFVLHEHTTLVTEPDSNVITVRHTATSPEKARTFTQAIVAAFIERHARQFSVEPYLEKNREKLVEAQDRRDAANKAYFDHLLQCGLIDFEAQRPVLLTVIDGLERDLFSARLRRDEARGEPNALLDQRIQRIEEKLDRLRECERSHAGLEMARTAEQERYANLFRRFSQLEDLGSIDLPDETNLAVLQPATFSFEKVGPNRLKLLLGSLAAGALFGVWVAVMREILDPRLRYPGAIERVLGVRVLCVIPEFEGHEAA